MLSTSRGIMKKLIKKLHRRDKTPPPTRITSETIEKHREHILAGGRRFKYPVQYARHKLVFNAIIISVSAIIIALAIGWWQLYPAQNTSEFMYRVTKVLPVSVAIVDGQPVLYSDYLMAYRSSVYFSEQKQQLNSKTDDGKRQIEYYKQQSMKEAIADAYAKKLSKNLGVTVSNSELESSLKDQRQSVNGETSQQTFDASILDILGLTPSEYRQKISNGLLRQKVSYAMDKNALNAANYIYSVVKSDPNTDFKALAVASSKQTNTKNTYSSSGWVPKSNQDGGRANEAAKLNKLEFSTVIKSTRGEGYYIIRLLDINNENVNYEYINIPLTVFTDSLEKITKDGKVSEFISIPNV